MALRSTRTGRGRRLGILAAVACLGLALSGCISTWSDLPEPPPAGAAKASLPGTLYYDIDVGTGLFGGGTALRDTFVQNAPFAKLEPLSEPPARGIFCRVDYERRSPSVASGVAAYISYAFLFAIPFWGTEGYLLRYHIYQDGQERKILEYPIERQSFGWILLLPVAWVNFLTPSEADAFSSTVHLFFDDAQPVFAEMGAARRGARSARR